MKKRPKFDMKKSLYAENSVYISKLLDPYTAHVAKWMYNLGFSANGTTLLTFFLGMAGIASLLIWRTYTGLIAAAILITLRNIGDTVDGKIARGSNSFSALGGFSDLVSDWIIFHAAFFVAIGILTNNIWLGFLCVTGYMSREFTRRKFTKNYGKKITETKEAKKMPMIVSLVRKYDLASAFWIIPFILLINPLWIIYAIAIIEYGLLIGELGMDFLLLYKKGKN